MKNIYPNLQIAQPQNVNRFYAVPIIGFFIKIIMLIPVFVTIFILSIFTGILVALINPFYVLAKGKYWPLAYDWATRILTYMAKIYFFFSGLTDKYPGFNFDTNGSFTLQFTPPSSPRKLYAIPILGILIRIVMLIPYIIYGQVLQMGSYVGAFFSFFKALFQGKYPESTYEFNRDTQRVLLAQSVYAFGLSDKYPSFHISMNHKGIKVALIVVGVILTIFNFHHRATHSFSAYPNQYSSSYYQSYQNYPNYQLPK